jgi:GxxExxY protein
VIKNHKIRKNIVYPNETYEIIGMMYDVWDEFGYGHKEKFYQKAIAEIFREKQKKFREQLRAKVNFRGKEIGVCILDFLYDEKIVIEIKQGEIFSRKDINQIFAYLKATELKLGLLIHFTKNGVRFKRIVNLQ